MSNLTEKDQNKLHSTIKPFLAPIFRNFHVKFRQKVFKLISIKRNWKKSIGRDIKRLSRIIGFSQNFNSNQTFKLILISDQHTHMFNVGTLFPFERA